MARVRNCSAGHVARLVPQSIGNFTPRSAEDAIFNPKTRTYDISQSFESAYNGRISIPVTGRSLTANICYPGVKIHVAIYDGNGEDGETFQAKYMSSRAGAILFTESINNGYFRYATVDQPELVNAYYAMLKYYEFLFTECGRIGLTNSEHCLIAVGNIGMVNAFWTGTYMAFGNGLDKCRPLTSVDVVSHEMTHGLQTFTTEFEYRGITGALNESIADIFGIAVEAYINSGKDAPDWTLGEMFDFVIRNVSNPHAHNQPKRVGDQFWVDPNGEADNGGVHTNSGVTNYLTFLATVGTQTSKPPAGVTYKNALMAVYDIINSQELSKSSATLEEFGRLFVANFGKTPELAEHASNCVREVGITSARSLSKIGVYRKADGDKYILSAKLESPGVAVVEFYTYQISMALMINPVIVEIRGSKPSKTVIFDFTGLTVDGSDSIESRSSIQIPHEGGEVRVVCGSAQYLHAFVHN